MSFNKLAGENPFLLWVLQLNDVNAAELKQGASSGVKDIILDAQGSRRFGLGVCDGLPYLGYVDKEAVEAVKWTSAAILLGRQNKDWIALSSTDARQDLTQALNPVPLRLFVQVSRTRVAAWKDIKPQELMIGPLTRNAKGEAVMSTSPYRRLPLMVD